MVGKNLKGLRKEQKDTQEECAEKIDLSRTFISQLESDKINKGVSLDTLFNLAIEYNIDIRLFFEGFEKFLKK